MEWLIQFQNSFWGKLDSKTLIGSIVVFLLGECVLVAFVIVVLLFFVFFIYALLLLFMDNTFVFFMKN